MTLNTAEHVETAPPERKARWNMDATMRNAALVQMAMVVDKKSSHSAACKASAVLLRAEAQNQRDEQRRRKKVVKGKVPVLDLGWGKANPAAEASAGAGFAGANSDSVVVGAKADRDLRPEAGRSEGTTVFATAGTNEKHDLRPEVKQDAGKAAGLGPQSWYATGPPPARR